MPDPVDKLPVLGDSLPFDDGAREDVIFGKQEDSHALLFTLVERLDRLNFKVLNK